MKKEVKIHTCYDCQQSFYSRYAFKNHSCKVITGFVSREEALANIRKDRANA